MKVLVTGASGFVGSHVVSALLARGHEVRAAARSVDRVRRALETHGCAGSVHIVAADVSKRDDVADALQGVDAVVHAAAAYSFDARRAGRIVIDNVRGAEHVLGAAAELGLDPIVHVSSYVALIPSETTVTADSPVGCPPTAYALSKARSEQVARDLQAGGASITIIQPGMVWGPDDPTLGETALFARAVLRGRLPFGLPGRAPVVDVRDVADAVAASVRPGQGPRRFLAASELVTLLELQRQVADTAGRRPPRGELDAQRLLALGRMADRLQRVIPVRLPLNHQAPWSSLNSAPFDATPTTRDLGVEFRPASVSVYDTVRWLLADKAGSQIGSSSSCPG